MTYLALGASAGYLGSRIDSSTEALLGIQKVTAVVLGILLILWGSLKLSGKSFALARDSKLPRRAAALYQRIFTRFEKVPHSIRSWIVGLLSTLLPCAWLYAFVAIALGSGGALLGAAMMGAFWLGTLPTLLTIGGVGRFLFDRLGRFAPLLSAVLIILAGVASITVHFAHSHHTHTSVEKHH